MSSQIQNTRSGIPNLVGTLANLSRYEIMIPNPTGRIRDGFLMTHWLPADSHNQIVLRFTFFHIESLDTQKPEALSRNCSLFIFIFTFFSLRIIVEVHSEELSASQSVLTL